MKQENGGFATDAELLLLISNGWTPEQIARRTNSTPKQIYDRAGRLQIDLRRQHDNSWRRGNRATIFPDQTT